ncbi:RNA polymerase, alpha chain C terminal domain [Lachnospiraceae bacterium]|nr:RNA polymerase, alpha chain C terminal domain [Lachnospiraceae bacterium]
MIELNENVAREMNKYLEGITIEEILILSRRVFHFKVMFTREQLQQDVEVLDLSVRAYHCLKRCGLSTLDKLVNGIYTKEDASSKRQLLRIRNLGRNTAEEILIKMFYYQFNVLPDSRKRDYMQQIVMDNLGAYMVN